MRQCRRVACEVLVCLLLFTAGLSGSEPLRLRVLSYNIHHAEGVDGKLDVPRIANVIRNSGADLVALQEVDRRATRTEKVDQPAELARLTGMKVLFEKNIDFQGGEYGNAILTRFDVLSHRNHTMPRHENGEQRGALEAQIQLPKPHGSLLFVSTHLDHRSDPGERLASARLLETKFKNRSGLPAILAGDLNTELKSDVMKIFLSSWHNSNGLVPKPTVPVSKPLRQIDFVLTRPQDRWRTVSVTVLDEKIASDHRPVLVVLELLHPGGH